MQRPLNEQVVVITGASSGIGRAAALEFARNGAAVVLAARNDYALNTLADEIQQMGGRVLLVTADVAEWDQVQKIAQEAVMMFGGIDTWVNDAAVAVYATVEDTTIDEFVRLMQVNYLGVVFGTKAALPIMKRQGSGTIINIGAIESQRALPYHSAYSATKHAVKAFTDTLRLELKHEKAPIHVTLLMPAGINTPFFEHARSRLGVMPMPAPPAYPPELVARAIVHAAHHKRRNVYVGGVAKMYAALEHISPKLTDRIMLTRGAMFRLQESDNPDDGEDILYTSSQGMGRIHGQYEAITKPSLYTPIFELTPRWARWLAAAAMLGAAGYFGYRQVKGA